MADEISSRPLVVIEPGQRGLFMNVVELWTYRDLLCILTLRDIRVRYKQTALGAAWAVLQPLLAMLIFTVFFGRIPGVAPDDVPYPLFALAGLLPWTFFSNAVTNSGNSLISSSTLITKVYFPRTAIPIAAVAAGLLDLAIGAVLLAILMAYYQVTPTPQLSMLLPLTVLVAGLAVGTGLWLSALNVKYRDVRYTLPFLMQMWFFATPVVFTRRVLPEQWRLLLTANPMTGLIEGYRAACFGTPFDWAALGVSTLLTLAILFVSTYTFRRMERSFADVI